MGIFDEAQTEAGHIEAGAPEFGEHAHGGQLGLLVGEAEAGHAEDGDDAELVVLAFEDDLDGEVMVAADVLAEEQFAGGLLEAFAQGRGPGLGGDGEALAHGLLDEFMGEQAHVFVVELAFVVLVVGAFVEGLGAGGLGGDGLAGVGIVDGDAEAGGGGAGEAGDGEPGIGDEDFTIVGAGAGAQAKE